MECNPEWIGRINTASLPNEFIGWITGFSSEGTHLLTGLSSSTMTGRKLNSELLWRLSVIMLRGGSPLNAISAPLGNVLTGPGKSRFSCFMPLRYTKHAVPRTLNGCRAELLTWSTQASSDSLRVCFRGGWRGSAMDEYLDPTFLFWPTLI